MHLAGCWWGSWGQATSQKSPPTAPGHGKFMDGLACGLSSVRFCSPLAQRVLWVKAGSNAVGTAVTGQDICFLESHPSSRASQYQLQGSWGKLGQGTPLKMLPVGVLWWPSG